jgi:hypothetical protein
VPPELKELDDEVEQDNKDSPPPTTFDNAKPKPCAGESHYMLKIVTTLKKKQIYTEYLENKCNADYHDNCASSWSGCDTHDSRTFCPKTCGSKNCYQMRFFGYLNPHERPKYDNTDCKDQSQDCQNRIAKGDSLSDPEGMSSACAESAGFCSADKDYLPYMPEEQKMHAWLKRYENKKYEKYSRYISVKRTITEKKVQRNMC